eukprot:TRINITY_DN10828_c0_g1_i1.p1 TRINITY_DN10828_c0_g1~~TRINITY_DN10828_c0_g1_i1.p1  ORF type:complete len:473 (+),score=164.77 TRINITY_DN10828_c0_g1_i1:305-1723(+)
MTASDEDTPTAPDVKRLSHGQLMSITFPLFPLWFHTTVLTIVLMPNQVLHFQGTGDRGVGYGITQTVAGVAGVVLGPIIGMLSDRTSTRWGRRRPWIFAGFLVNCGLGVMLSMAPSLLVFSVLMFFDVITFMMCYMNISSLVPDVVPESQSGTASGYMQLFMMAGGFAGSLLGLFAVNLGSAIPGAFQFNTYAVEIGITFLGIPVLFFVPERKAEPRTRSSAPLLAQLRPFWNLQFALLVLLNMVTYGFANVAVQNYYQYYVADMLVLPQQLTPQFAVTNVEAASALFNVANLLGAVIASWPVGRLADRLGRRWILAAAMLCQMVVPLVMMFTHSLLADLLCNIVYGAGFMATQLLGFAILTELLPTLNPDGDTGEKQLLLKKARSTNVGLGTSLYIMLSVSLPSLFVPMLYGYVLDYFTSVHHRIEAYYVIYGSSVFVLVAMLFILPALRTKYEDDKKLPDLSERVSTSVQ